MELRNATGTLLGDARQGDVIGAASLLFGGRQELSAIAAGPVEAAMVDRATVAAQMARNPELVRRAATQLLSGLALVPLAETGGKRGALPHRPAARSHGPSRKPASTTRT